MPEPEKLSKWERATRNAHKIGDRGGPITPEPARHEFDCTCSPCLAWVREKTSERLERHDTLIDHFLIAAIDSLEASRKSEAEARAKAFGEAAQVVSAEIARLDKILASVDGFLGAHGLASNKTPASFARQHAVLVRLEAEIRAKA